MKNAFILMTTTFVGTFASLFIGAAHSANGPKLSVDAQLDLVLQRGLLGIGIGLTCGILVCIFLKKRIVNGEVKTENVAGC